MIAFAFVSAVILLSCYIQSVLLLATDGALDAWCCEALPDWACAGKMKFNKGEVSRVSTSQLDPIQTPKLC